MKDVARLAAVGIAVIVVGTVGLAIGGRGDAPEPRVTAALPDIVVGEGTVPARMAIYRTVHGAEALGVSEAAPGDVVGLVDAIETAFDDDDDHEGDREGRYATFAAAFETVAHAQRALDAAAALHEADDGWALPADESRTKPVTDPGLGAWSVHYAPGHDYGYPEISVYLWRVDNVLLHAVDFHPYDHPDLIEAIVSAMNDRAKATIEEARDP